MNVDPILPGEIRPEQRQYPLPNAEIADGEVSWRSPKMLIDIRNAVLITTSKRLNFRLLACR